MDTRQQKARIILASGGVMWAGGCYRVASQSGTGFYRVPLHGLFPTCACEHHDLTGDKCKHIIAAELWADEQRNPKHGPPAPPPESPKRKTYSQRWREYDA